MFDLDKYFECPYCKDNNKSDDNVTVTMKKSEDDAITMAYSEFQEDSITVYNEYSNKTSRLLAGWLVCISDHNKGKCYSVFEGRNFAGRSREMDIYLPDDNYISRQRHFSIVYEPRKKEFLLVPGNGELLLNDNPLLKVTVIKENDIITVGKSKAIFVPYCTKERNWDEENK